MGQQGGRTHDRAPDATRATPRTLSVQYRQVVTADCYPGGGARPSYPAAAAPLGSSPTGTSSARAQPARSVSVKPRRQTHSVGRSVRGHIPLDW